MSSRMSILYEGLDPHTDEQLSDLFENDDDSVMGIESFEDE